MAPDNTAGCQAASYPNNVDLATILKAVLLPTLILFLIGLVLYYRSRRTNTTLLNTNTELTVQLLEKETEVAKYRKVWHIAPSEVTFSESIGKGSVGEVYKGIWRGIDVAIKTVKGAWMSSEEMEKELDHEASMLQSVRHANVVQFFGMGTMGDGTPFIVIELMELGTLTEILRNDQIELDWQTRTKFALETAQGMALVHSLGRMHRDLKSGNILVTASGPGGAMRVKVADFGTATLAGIAVNASDIVAVERVTESRLTVPQRGKSMRTKGIGTPLWMAPEILSGSPAYGASADVYSYGIVMWEIASRQEPWKEIKTNFLIQFMDQLLQKVSAGIRPPVADEWPKDYVALMKECWCSHAYARPIFASIVARLGKMLASLNTSYVE